MRRVESGSAFPSPSSPLRSHANGHTFLYLLMGDTSPSKKEKTNMSNKARRREPAFNLSSGSPVSGGEGERKRQRRKATFPGAEELRTLARGMAEVADEMADDFPLKGEKRTELDSEKAPSWEKWLLAEPDLDEKKKPKPQCVAGNASHKSKDGKFGKKGGGYAGSWSITHPGGAASDPDCSHGQAKLTGKGKGQRFTKTRCGRKLKGGKPDPDGNKADYRCHDGKKIREYEDLTSMDGNGLISLTADQLRMLIKAVVEDVLDSPEAQSLVLHEQEVGKCSTGCMTWQQCLAYVGTAVEASKGNKD